MKESVRYDVVGRMGNSVRVRVSSLCVLLSLMSIVSPLCEIFGRQCQLQRAFVRSSQSSP